MSNQATLCRLVRETGQAVMTETPPCSPQSPALLIALTGACALMRITRGGEAFTEVRLQRRAQERDAPPPSQSCIPDLKYRKNETRYTPYLLLL